VRAISNVLSLQYDHVRVQVVATKSSLVFLNAGMIKEMGTNVWVDEDEWDVRILQSYWSLASRPSFLQSNYKVGDPILHIELRRWADIVLIAPCSANTLSKVAHGACDNLAVRPSAAASGVLGSTGRVFRHPSCALLHRRRRHMYSPR
jgi:phosphopantothenoylcysteine synthetase/decarboxylase